MNLRFRILFGAVCELCGYVACLVTLSMLLQEVGEEENLQYDKDYEQFDEDNSP